MRIASLVSMALIITARNLSGLADTSDYEVGAWINDHPIWKGRVTGHHRAEGWAVLARMIADAFDEEGSKPSCK